MVKKLIKKILLLAALIILAAYTVPAIIYGNWKETSFLWELVLISALICTAQLLLNKFKSDYYLIEVLAEYLMVCTMVGIAGLIFQWFKVNYLWQVFVYVTPVYVIGYFLDLGRTRRDVAYINEKIKQRSERGFKDEQCDDNR